MKYALVLLAWCSGWSILVPAVYAQQVQVLDNSSGKPIAYVTVVNEDKTLTAISDSEGWIDVSIFTGDDLLRFQHPTYVEVVLRRSEIGKGPIRLTETVLQIPGVVISANKWEQDAAEIPNKIVALDEQMIDYYAPQTSADLLSNSGEVFVQKSQLGGGSPKLRGFSANSTLIVIDGVRMNNAIYRSGNLQNVISIDPNTLSGAEIILGPGSVIYGSDALGGVMDFHTKDPGYSGTEKMTLSGSTLARYSTANKEKTGHADLNIGSKRLALYSSFTYSNFDDLRAGKNRNNEYPGLGKRRFFVQQDDDGDDKLVENSEPEVQTPSGFDSWHTVQKLSFKPGDKTEFTYGFYLSNTTDIPRYDALTEPLEGSDSLANAAWFYGPQKWIMHTLKTEIKAPTALFDQARITAAYQDYEESRNDRMFGSESLRSRTEQVDIYSINIDVDKGVGTDHSLFYGLEYLHNSVSSTAFRESVVTGERSETSTRYPDGGSTYRSAAMYGSYIHRFKKFVLSGGLRFTHVSLNAKTSNPEASFVGSNVIDLNNQALNGSLGVAYRGLKNQKLSLMFSSGFRAPNVDDLGKVFELNRNAVVVPNESLEPEYSYNSELSWYGSVQRFGWRLTGFYTLLDNAIVRGASTVNGQDSILIDGSHRKIFTQVNAGNAVIFGGSLQLSYQLTNRLLTTLNIIETAGQERDTNEPLRHTTPVFGQLSMVYTNQKLRAEIFSAFNGARYRNDIPTAEIDGKPYLYAQHQTDRDKDGSPAWATLNFRARYKLTGTFEVSAALENILDLHYRPYSSGISAPGRNFMLALRAQF